MSDFDATEESLVVPFAGRDYHADFTRIFSQALVLSFRSARR
jgi:hypothetical protein